MQSLAVTGDPRVMAPSAPRTVGGELWGLPFTLNLRGEYELDRSGSEFRDGSEWGGEVGRVGEWRVGDGEMRIAAGVEPVEGG